MVCRFKINNIFKSFTIEYLKYISQITEDCFSSIFKTYFLILLVCVCERENNNKIKIRRYNVLKNKL